MPIANQQIQNKNGNDYAAFLLAHPYNCFYLPIPARPLAYTPKLNELNINQTRVGTKISDYIILSLAQGSNVTYASRRVKDKNINLKKSRSSYYHTSCFSESRGPSPTLSSPSTLLS